MTTISRIVCPPRYATPRTPERATLGPAIGEVARLLGKPFMPWQQYVADVLGEIDPDTGRLAYSEFGLTVPRQSGKSTLILAKAVHRAVAGKFFGARQHIVYTAQTRKDAKKKFEEDYDAVFDESRYFRPKVSRRYGNGNEHIRFPNGSRFGIEANTEKAGHGGTLDEAYIDEAFAQADSRLEQAFRPAMITRPNKQLGWISTAGWLDGSPYLRAKAERGRAQVEMGIRSGLAYFEWSAPEDADPADPEVWRECMPALGHTITEDAIAAELASMVAEGRLNDFRRAYLNQWVPRSGEETRPGMPAEAWRACYDQHSTAERAGAIGVDVTPDRSTVNIAVAGRRPDGLPHIELAYEMAGVARSVDLLAGMHARHGAPVVVDPRSHALALVPELLRAGVEVRELRSSEVAQACTGMFDAVVQGFVRHPGQAQVTNAVTGATTKELAGGFKWMPAGQVSISPLWAVTLALYGLSSTSDDSDGGGWAVAL